MRSHLATTYLDDANPLAGEDYNDEPTVAAPDLTQAATPRRAQHLPQPVGGLGQEITLPGGIRMPVGTLVTILAAVAAVALILYLRNRRR